MAVANVQHLATLVEGRLSSPGAVGPRAGGRPAPHAGGGRLAPRRAPSPGSPSYEGLDRGRYAGPVGWVDAARQRHVGRRHLRSAELDGTGARLFAGVGVVADSDPAAELAETQAKLQALLTALVRP